MTTRRWASAAATGTAGCCSTRFAWAIDSTCRSSSSTSRSTASSWSTRSSTSTLSGMTRGLTFSTSPCSLRVACQARPIPSSISPPRSPTWGRRCSKPWACGFIRRKVSTTPQRDLVAAADPRAPSPLRPHRPDSRLLKPVACGLLGMLPVSLPQYVCLRAGRSRFWLASPSGRRAGRSGCLRWVTSRCRRREGWADLACSSSPASKRCCGWGAQRSSWA